MDKYICNQCYRENFLAQKFKTESLKGWCTYCDDHLDVIPLTYLADEVHRVIEAYFEKTAIGPEGLEYTMWHDSEIDYEWEREGQEIKYLISDLLVTDEEIADDIRVHLNELYHSIEDAEMGVESNYDQDARYLEKAHNDWDLRNEWRAFENSVRDESRFFNPKAKMILDKVFRSLEQLKGPQRGCVVNAGPGEELDHLYRAREFGSYPEIKKKLANLDVELGPPPGHLITGGRMNASGISVFYGAIQREVALSEVRPSVGSMVVTAKFDIVSGIKLLDLKVLEAIFSECSIFDGSYHEEWVQAEFLTYLSHWMSRPVRSSDEAFGYLVTQVVAEYLATVKKFDGIIYPSSQLDGEGVNVVLFRHVSGVKKNNALQDSEIEVHTHTQSSDGFDVDYRVLVRSGKASGNDKKKSEGKGMLFAGDFNSTINDSLRLDYSSVRVHEIEQIKYREASDRVDYRFINTES